MKNLKVLSNTKRICSNIVMLFSLLIISASTHAQSWSAFGGGTNNTVYASVLFQGQLVIAGSFIQANGGKINYIATWNGSGWDSMKGGTDGEVRALAVYNNQLIVAGSFGHSGGVTTHNISIWDGSGWSDMGDGTDAEIYALTVFGSKLEIGGVFTSIDGNPATYIAEYDGSAWNSLDTSIKGSSPKILALMPYGNKLIAAGSFSTAGTSTSTNIAAWDGTAWSNLGSGTDDIVNALTVYKGNLIAGGNFAKAGGNSASRIASWNGTAWSVMGSGCTGGNVFAVDTLGTSLIVGGSFNSAGGNSAGAIAKWDGTSWSTLGTGVGNTANNPVVYSLCDDSIGIIVGGAFATAGGNAANNLAFLSGIAVGINVAKETNMQLGNYPNPFLYSTEIFFTLPQSGYVKLSIYDQTGRTIKVIVDGYRTAGEYNFEFIPSGTQSGVFFYKLETGYSTNTGKMVLLK